MSVEGATGRSPEGEPGNAAASMEIFMSGLEKSLGHALKPLEVVSKQIGGSKFGKNVKAFGGALKGMAGASIQAWAMEQLMKLIEPFMKLLLLLEIPINILASLLNVFVNEIFVALLPFIMDFTKILIDLMPLFKFLGQVVGVVLVWAVNQIIDRFKLIIEIWKVIFAFLGEKLAPVFKKLQPIFKWLGDFIKGIFLPLWEGIKKAFFLLRKAWDDSGGKLFGKDGFIAKALTGLLDIGKGIINGFIGTINRVLNLINKIPGVDITPLPRLQEGGFTVGTGLALLHPNEFVVPLERAPEFGKDPALLEAIEEGNRQRAIIIKQNRERSAWRL